MAKGEDDLSIVLQDRDWKLMRGLFESRVMARKHIQALYFPGVPEMCKNRVRLLIREGLIRERPRRHRSEPAVLFLSRLSFRLLREHGDLSDYPNIGIDQLEKRVQVSELKLRHELEVIDVKAAMVSAIRATTKYTVAEFSTWPILYEFRSCEPSGREVTTQPDAFIRIEEALDDGWANEHTFFLEVDRSEEATIILADRAHCYDSYYQDGGLAVRNGRKREDYKEFKFRVLVVCKTAERRNNLAAKMLLNTQPIRGQVWLTTMAEVISDSLGPIWIRPADYRDVTKDTPFDPYVQPTSPIYRRSVEREAFIDRVVRKHSIIT